jgi:hypothetical protein
MEIKGTFGTFYDEHAPKHWVVGGSLPVYFNSRFSAAPEVLYMRASKADQDWLLEGLGTVNIRTPPKTLQPYWTSGIAFTHSKQAGWTPPFLAGLFRFGLKIFVTERVFLTPELNLDPGGNSIFMTMSAGYVVRQRTSGP